MSIEADVMQAAAPASAVAASTSATPLATAASPRPSQDHASTLAPKPPMHSAITSQPMDDISTLGDVLLGDEMTMMGGDVESSWAPSSTATTTSNSAFAPQQQQASYHQPTSFFNCPPAQLSRHSSLPVSMMRSHQHAFNVFGVPSPSAARATTPTMRSHHQQQQQQQHPPMLARQRSHGYLMHHQHQHQPYPITRNVTVSMHGGLELGLSHQHQPHHLPPTVPTMSTKTADLFAPPTTANAMNLEPIAFNSAIDQKTMNEGFDLDPVAFSVLGDVMSSGTSTGTSAVTTDASNNKPTEIKHEVKQEYQNMDSAFESLDKLLPEMDQDLFQAAELNSLPGANPPRSFQTMTPRPVMSSARGSLPLIVSPHLKTISASPSAAAAMVATFGDMGLNMSPMSTAGTPRTKNAATCKVAGCDRRVRSKGFCKTHGGGRKCSIPGCKKSSQNGEFCIGHGGGKKCKEDGCAKAAQSHGLCKAHGGGARCKFPNCTKSSQGGGLCRAHGGGKRCQAPGCPKGAQRGNFCATHGGFRNCKIDNCVRTDRGGGFCEVHRRGRLCKIDGCKKLSRNQGMCTMHIREEKQELTQDQSALPRSPATSTSTLPAPAAAPATASAAAPLVA